MNTVATVTRARVRDGFELAATRRTLPIALLRAREAVMDRFRPVLSRHDVSEQQWRVLRVLQETGTMDAATLAALACVLPPSLTRMLKALEARGLIDVARHPEDGRRAQIDLTRPGEELIREIAPQSARIYDDIEARVGHDRIERLLDELEWVLGALDANAGDGGAKRRA